MPYTRPTYNSPFSNGSATDATVIIDALSDGLEAVEAALPGKAATSHGTHVPGGGTTGQVLKKTSNADGAVSWQTDDTGGGVSNTVGTITQWDFSTSTTMTDPGAGNFRFNSASMTAPTQMVISETDDNAATATALLARLNVDDEIVFILGSSVRANNAWTRFKITSITDSGSFWTIGISNVKAGGGALWANGTQVQLETHLNVPGSAVSSGGYATIENKGVALTQREVLDVIGTDARAVDDAPNTQTTLLVSALYPPCLENSTAKGPVGINKNGSHTVVNKLFFVPVYLWTIESFIGLQTRTPIGGSATIRMAVYDCTTQPSVGAPHTVGSKINATEVSSASPGNNLNVYAQFASAWTPPANGWYWLGIAIDGSTTTLNVIECSGLFSSVLTPGLGAANFTPVFENFGGYTTGTLPAAGIGGPASSISPWLAPLIQIRR